MPNIQLEDGGTIELTADEVSFLASYKWGPRIWDAASLQPSIWRLHELGLLTGDSSYRSCWLTDLGRDVLAQVEAV